MLKFDEGPCFNWPPSEVKSLTEDEIAGYYDALLAFRKAYAEHLDPSLKTDIVE